MSRTARAAGWATTITALAIATALLSGCGLTGSAAPSPPIVPAAPAQSPAAQSPATSAAAPQPARPASDDPATLWETWTELNVICRGSSGPESVDACQRRSAVQERQARLVATQFFAAWTRGDSAAMAGLTHPDNASDSGWRIPAKLASYRPTEPAFDCRYDMTARTPFGCYTAVTGSGADLFVTFDIDDGRGWLARSFRPDV